MRRLIVCLTLLTSCEREVRLFELVSARADVAAGEHHTGALAGGALFAWGTGARGELGVSATIDATRPLRAFDLALVELRLGASTSCGRSGNGDVYCWGANHTGILALPDLIDRGEPVQIPLPAPAANLGLRYVHACAILIDQTLWCWGDNGENQVDGSSSAVVLSTPVQVPGHWIQVAPGQGHTCAVKNDGTVWCWGRNLGNASGAGSDVDRAFTPTRIDVPLASSVVVGTHHSCALSRDDEVFCWGENNGGVLGNGDFNARPTPTLVAGGDWQFVSAGVLHACAIKRDGSLWCWGRTVEGQAGMQGVSLPTPVQVGDDTRWVEVACGRFHTCARRLDGAVLCTGDNGSGELGLGDRARRHEFTPVQLE